MPGLTREEHETLLSIDYAEETAHLYTTRRGEKNAWLRRLEPADRFVKMRTIRNGEDVVAWDLTIPLDLLRDTTQGALRGRKWIANHCTGEEEIAA